MYISKLPDERIKRFIESYVTRDLSWRNDADVLFSTFLRLPEEHRIFVETMATDGKYVKRDQVMLYNFKACEVNKHFGTEEPDEKLSHNWVKFVYGELKKVAPEDVQTYKATYKSMLNAELKQYQEKFEAMGNLD